MEKWMVIYGNTMSHFTTMCVPKSYKAGTTIGQLRGKKRYSACIVAETILQIGLKTHKRWFSWFFRSHCTPYLPFSHNVPFKMYGRGFTPIVIVVWVLRCQKRTCLVVVFCAIFVVAIPHFTAYSLWRYIIQEDEFAISLSCYGAIVAICLLSKLLLCQIS